MFPLLLPYQARWIADESRVQIAEKSRRIGITWASAIRAVTEASLGVHDTYYTGYKFQLAEEFIRNAADFARALHLHLEQDSFLFDDVDSNDEPRTILAHRITFASGKRIIALSSSPRNMRGIQGRIIIDEFAFHDNPSELLKAAMATLIWGGKVSIISTHNGEANEFNKLIQDTRAGRFAYSVHRCTFDDAIADGLYERVAAVGRLDTSAEAKKAWRQEVIDHYGDGAPEELFCIPSRSGGVYLSPMLIEACMRSDFKVHRLNLEDGYALKSDAEQAEQIEPWLASVAVPACRSLNARMPTFVGEDFGRRSDMTAIALAQYDQLLCLNVPHLFELRNVPFETQKTILLRMCGAVPKFGRITMDSSGNGMYLGEVMAQHYGDAMVDRVGISVEVGVGEHADTRSLPWLKWYADNLPRLKARFEDASIAIPKDYDVRADLTAFEIVNGVPTLPKVRAESKMPDAAAGSKRHGDAAIAIALAEYAARMGEIDITSIERVTRGGEHYPGPHSKRATKRIW